MSEAKRRLYTDEFKTEAVRFARDPGRPVAQELGIKGRDFFKRAAAFFAREHQ